MMDMPAPDRYLPAADVRRLLPGALTRPAQEGARLLALHWLHQLVDARQAWQTLPQTVTSDESDPAHHEATRKAAAADVLHKARVALRRLRATLREHDSVLDGTIDRRLARALRALGQATNDVRDSDVQRAWLEAEHDHLPDEARAEAQRLRERLERRSQRASTDVESAFRRHFDPIVERLLGRLSTYRLLKRVGGVNAPTPYGGTWRPDWREQAVCAGTWNDCATHTPKRRCIDCAFASSVSARCSRRSPDTRRAGQLVRSGDPRTGSARRHPRCAVAGAPRAQPNCRHSNRRCAIRCSPIMPRS